MIIRGNKCRQALRVGKYLLAQGKNDRIELIGIRGTLSSDILCAVAEMNGLATGSRAEKPFFFVSINFAEGEYLSPEQWEHAWAIYEKNQGLEGHQRIIVQHEKEGRVHQHALYNRVNRDTMKAAPMSNDYYKNEMTSRQLEKIFGFAPVKGRLFLKENERPANRSPTYNEIIQGKRNGVNVRRWREEIRQILAERENINGIELVAAFEEKGYMVARGKVSYLVMLDPSGTPHNMVKTLNLRIGTGEFKTRFGDIAPAGLPTIEQAQEMQNLRLFGLGAAKKAPEKCNSSHIMAGKYNHEHMANQLTNDLHLAIDRYNATHQVRTVKRMETHGEMKKLIQNRNERFTYNSSLKIIAENASENILKESYEISEMLLTAIKQHSNNQLMIESEITDEKKYYYHQLNEINKNIEINTITNKIFLGLSVSAKDFHGLIINDIERICQNGRKYFDNIFQQKERQRTFERER